MIEKSRKWRLGHCGYNWRSKSEGSYKVPLILAIAATDPEHPARLEMEHEDGPDTSRQLNIHHPDVRITQKMEIKGQAIAPAFFLLPIHMLCMPPKIFTRRSLYRIARQIRKLLPMIGIIDFSVAVVLLVCFNPRTRNGCDLQSRYSSSRHLVSIHAPAMGATRALSFQAPCPAVSIHAPAKDTTVNIVNYCKLCSHLMPYA